MTIWAEQLAIFSSAHMGMSVSGCSAAKPAPPAYPSLRTQGSYRTVHKGYEEVHVPALKPKPFGDGAFFVCLAWRAKMRRLPLQA